MPGPGQTKGQVEVLSGFELVPVEGIRLDPDGGSTFGIELDLRYATWIADESMALAETSGVRDPNLCSLLEPAAPPFLTRLETHDDEKDASVPHADELCRVDGGVSQRLEVGWMGAGLGSVVDRLREPIRAYAMRGPTAGRSERDREAVPSTNHPMPSELSEGLQVDDPAILQSKEPAAVDGQRAADASRAGQTRYLQRLPHGIEPRSAVAP